MIFSFLFYINFKQIKTKEYAWEDFYESNSLEESNIFVNKKYDNSINDLKRYQSNQLYVNNCLFSYCSDTQGGAISSQTTGQTLNSLIEYSIFESCSSLTNGGSIYLDINGDCILFRDCAYQSNCESKGSFCYIITPQYSIFNEIINDTSICYINNLDLNNNQTNITGVVYMYGSFQTIVNSNISKNTYPETLLYFNEPYLVTIQYSSIAYNTAERNALITEGFQLTLDSIICKISFTNFFNNSQIDTESNPIYLHHRSLFDNCCFYENNFSSNSKVIKCLYDEFLVFIETSVDFFRPFDMIDVRAPQFSSYFVNSHFGTANCDNQLYLPFAIRTDYPDQYPIYPPINIPTKTLQIIEEPMKKSIVIIASTVPSVSIAAIAVILVIYIIKKGALPCIKNAIKIGYVDAEDNSEEEEISESEYSEETEQTKKSLIKKKKHQKMKKRRESESI